MSNATTHPVTPLDFSNQQQQPVMMVDPSTFHKDIEMIEPAHSPTNGIVIIIIACIIILLIIILIIMYFQKKPQKPKQEQQVAPVNLSEYTQLFSERQARAEKTHKEQEEQKEQSEQHTEQDKQHAEQSEQSEQREGEQKNKLENDDDISPNVELVDHEDDE